MTEKRKSVSLLMSVDTGGTFTDFIHEEEGRFRVFKLPSSLEDPSIAVLQGLGLVTGSRPFKVVHGSTVATNALLEKKGAKTAVITNKGFEDVLEIGRQTRSRIYDLLYCRRDQLVDSELRHGIDCRIDSGGNKIQEVNREELLAVVESLRSSGVESVAICFLFSFLDPSDELLVEKMLEGTGIDSSLSSRVLGEFREYERLSTTVVNAYVRPVMRRYIDRITSILGDETLSIMQSNGGRVSAKTASTEPVRTILSGPAGGVVGAFRVGKQAGFERIMSFDMGGTSTDVSLIDGELPITTDTVVAGLPVRVPMIDIHTVGAGGGSIARFDKGGALTVGPESAGAHPGPVCYGKGGVEPTVTDANLLMGRLLPESFLGGSMTLFREPVGEVFSNLARSRGMSIIELAEGICTVANSNMERALRGVSVEKGHDPQDFVLVTFGGAGAMHAVFLARSLGIPTVLIPQNPGILSAMGMLLSDVIRDYSVTVMKELAGLTRKDFECFFEPLESRAVGEMENEGFGRQDFLIERYLDLRYKGQSYELMIAYADDLPQAFHEAHHKVYGYHDDSRTIEIVNARARAEGKTEKPCFKSNEALPEKTPSDAVIGTTRSVFGGESTETTIYERSLLCPGFRLSGPAIITEYSSTTVLPPDVKLSVDCWGNLLVDCVQEG